MKKTILLLVLAFIGIGAFAQKSSLLRQRMEIVELESETSNVNLQVFYMNDENPRVYYLSLGNLGVGVDLVQIDFDPVFELFIPLGGTLEEAIAKMEEIKAFFKLPRQTATELEGSFSAAYPSDRLQTVTVTSRRLLSSKILEFSLPTDTNGIVRATYVTKGKFGSLLSSLKLYKKIHPKEK